MSYSRRTIIGALVGLTAITGCGYTPAFGPGGPAKTLQVQMGYKAPTTRNEFDLVSQLELRLGRAAAPVYRLSYDISTTQDGVGLTPEQEITRFNIFGKVRYELTEIATGEMVDSGSIDTFTGYSVGAIDLSVTPPTTNATISTLAANRDANARLMVALADQIVTQLIASSPDWLN